MIYSLDPLRDPRWAALVDSHHAGSVFHSVPWLEAVRRAYNYRPIVYTSCAPGTPLTNGIVFCEVASWLTGRRMVSVPFADHCQPLVDAPDERTVLYAALKAQVDAGRWKYIELRPTVDDPPMEGQVAESPSCFLHSLDLTPELPDLLRATHKTAIQQPIKRAEREGLICESGSSERLLAAFYQLLIQTRRRHMIPPQPIAWFRHLIACMGPQLTIRVAFKDAQPIASILTLRHGSTLVYKYGCSDAAFSNLGGTAFLLWKTIGEAKADGVTRLDFGRSDADNTGLITFKNRWGAVGSTLTYLRWAAAAKPGSARAGGRGREVLKQIFSRMPDPVLKAAGNLLYRHVG